MIEIRVGTHTRGYTYYSNFIPRVGETLWFDGINYPVCYISYNIDEGVVAYVYIKTY